MRASGLRGCGTDARKAKRAEPRAELTNEEGESQEPEADQVGAAATTVTRHLARSACMACCSLQPHLVSTY